MEIACHFMLYFLQLSIFLLNIYSYFIYWMRAALIIEITLKMNIILCLNIYNKLFSEIETDKLFPQRSLRQTLLTLTCPDYLEHHTFCRQNFPYVCKKASSSPKLLPSIYLLRRRIQEYRALW
jgi:hypothetical protein